MIINLKSYIKDESVIKFSTIQSFHFDEKKHF
jgi:hypothetical protein